MKYANTQVVFREYPDEISLAINISNCPFKCKGCHSQYLQEDIGRELDESELDNLIKSNPGITLVGFQGGDREPEVIERLANYIKDNYDLGVGWYSGREELYSIDYQSFKWVKVGKYKEGLGGLDSPATNQKLYRMENGEILYQYFFHLT